MVVLAEVRVFAKQLVQVLEQPHNNHVPLYNSSYSPVSLIILVYQKISYRWFLAPVLLTLVRPR